ncbi:hypothetical protein PsAD14_04717 [Pseudovibrio sp. Ad14]|nr:hypothetical protein PsW74_03595 [Pseudovibrio sp. W74]KZL05276.1 hypothetical protein PsAD14_04717 [Pseudovibrio sp. Ad14]
MIRILLARLRGENSCAAKKISLWGFITAVQRRFLKLAGNDLLVKQLDRRALVKLSIYARRHVSSKSWSGRIINSHTDQIEKSQKTAGSVKIKLHTNGCIGLIQRQFSKYQSFIPKSPLLPFARRRSSRVQQIIFDQNRTFAHPCGILSRNMLSTCSGSHLAF